MSTRHWLAVAVLLTIVTGCDLADPYGADGWGSTGREVPGPVGPTVRPDWDQIKEDAAAIIEEALPTSTDLGPVDDDELGVSPFGTESFEWIPAATRDTRLPPGNHGRRIYQVEVFTTPTADGEAVTVVTFDAEFGPMVRFDLSTEASQRLLDVLMPQV